MSCAKDFHTGDHDGRGKLVLLGDRARQCDIPLLSSHVHRLAARDTSMVGEVTNTQRGISRNGSKAACEQHSASCSPGAHFILPYIK